MFHKKFALLSATALFAAAVACSNSPETPASPGGLPAGEGNAAPDGSTLKVTAPTPQSPVNNAQVQSLSFVAAAATPRHGAAMPALTHQLEIKNTGGTTVCNGSAEASGPTVTITPNCTLNFGESYTWRMRAVRGSAVGPWSSAANFQAPSGGYITNQEVYDPLINGVTVGEIQGSVTFIPGVGVRLNDVNSHIRYRIPQTIVEGEFSLIITGVATNTEGDKTKVFAMSEGLDDIVVNDRRMTVEKRGDPEGIVAWRFISHEDQVDTEGAEREFVAFDENLPYFWNATWRGQFFNVSIHRGGRSGPEIYGKGKHYQGAYDPNPHYAFIGAPVGRSGPSAATVPGMIVRHVWISRNPRPASLPSQ